MTERTFPHRTVSYIFGLLILATIQKIVALSPLSESCRQGLASLGVFIILQSVILAQRAKTKRKAMDAAKS